MAYFNHGDLRLHYQHLVAPEEIAPDTLIVGLHGLVMDNLSSLYFTLGPPLTQAGFSLLLLDIRGHGLSARPTGGYRVSALVEELRAFLSATPEAEGKSIYLLGNSFGALLGLEFARRWPSELAGLILIDPHLYDDAFQTRLTDTLSLQGEARDLKIAENFQRWLGRHQQRRSRRLASRARALVEETTLIEELRAEPATQLEELREISCPTLALYGEESDARGSAEPLQATLPVLELCWFSGCSHSLIWEAGVALPERLIDWLKRHVSLTGSERE